MVTALNWLPGLLICLSSKQLLPNSMMVNLIEELHLHLSHLDFSCNLLYISLIPCVFH